MYDYKNDPIGQLCLNLAECSKSDMKFGSVLVKDGIVLGKGWNRLSTAEERRVLTHVDYAVHAEQGAIIEAICSQIDISGSEIYVLGRNKNKQLTTVDTKLFTCKRCAVSLVKLNISVNIPYVEGWLNLTPTEAYQSACNSHGYWTEFRSRKT